MINRQKYIKHIKRALGRSRAVALLGPRQVGKTTLVRELVDINSPNYFDLEDSNSLIALSDAKTIPEPLKGIGVIYLGKNRYTLHKRIEVVPFDQILSGRNKIFKGGR